MNHATNPPPRPCRIDWCDRTHPAAQPGQISIPHRRAIAARDTTSALIDVYLSLHERLDGKPPAGARIGVCAHTDTSTTWIDLDTGTARLLADILTLTGGRWLAHQLTAAAAALDDARHDDDESEAGR